MENSSKIIRQCILGDCIDNYLDYKNIIKPFKDLINMKVLVIAAHPDDEILGCAGTISKHIKNRDKVRTVILGEGITSRDDKRNTKLIKINLIN